MSELFWVIFSVLIAALLVLTITFTVKSAVPPNRGENSRWTTALLEGAKFLFLTNLFSLVAILVARVFADLHNTLVMAIIFSAIVFVGLTWILSKPFNRKR